MDSVLCYHYPYEKHCSAIFQRQDLNATVSQDTSLPNLACIYMRSISGQESEAPLGSLTIRLDSESEHSNGAQENRLAQSADSTSCPQVIFTSTMYSTTSSTPGLANHTTPSSSKDIRRAKTEKYTEDTKFVAMWLKTEAENLPDIDYLLELHVSEDGRVYDLKLGNFVRLAERLVEESGFTVTRDVMEAIYSIIKLRKECNYIHEKEGLRTAEERQKHKYPVQVFKELAKILRPYLEGGSVSPSAEPDTTSLSSSAVGQARSEQEARDAVWPKLPGKH